VGTVSLERHKLDDVLQVEDPVRRHKASDVGRLMELEAEHSRLKQMYADLSLENRALKDVDAKKVVRPGGKRKIVTHVYTLHGLSITRACHTFGLSRAVYGY